MPFHYGPVRRGRDLHPRNPALQAGVFAARPPRHRTAAPGLEPGPRGFGDRHAPSHSAAKIREPRVTGRGSQMGGAEEGRVELPPAGRPGQVSNPLRRTVIRLSSTQNGARGRTRTCCARSAPVLQTGVPPRDTASLAAGTGLEPV